ncbi:tetratricopeptide repeat protein [Chryseobacterium sp. KMC2]|uniref:tetratricopeptide repeat protein n=1 Tax=Chryseobacterium sp. KMC2 TaxID=2800705 RepID=UPI0019240D92|nr:tetratricopeptide repeat protein [Chryseobacterium sp. KMC2]MBL3547983.1 tetratricopeptide repeat protein [Chryseobacterium sp. KMC2]
MIRSLLFMVLIILVSCTPDYKKYEKSFDIPLIHDNEKLRLLGEYDALINLNTDYYRKADEIGYQEGKALCYMNLARLNISTENYQKADVLFNQAEGILKHSKSNLHQAIFYNNYSKLNAEMHNLNKSLEYNSSALDYIKRIDESPLKKELLSEIYTNRAAYLDLNKQPNKSLPYLREAQLVHESRRLNVIFGEHYVWFEQRLDSAEIYLRKVVDDPDKEKAMDIDALTAHTILAECYIWDKQYDKAEKNLERALEIDKKTRDVYTYYTKYIYNDFKWLYKERNDDAKAYFYLQTFADAKHKTTAALLATINQDMESFINETKKDAKRHDDKIRWVILLSGICFSVLGIYAWRIIDLLKKKKGTLKTETEKLKARVEENQPDEILELAKKNDPEFFNRFKECYPHFIISLFTINPNLEVSELTFCAMLKLHFTSKEIATYTLIQHRTVQQKKYRIRKKLNIPTEIDIYQFFDNLG